VERRKAECQTRLLHAVYTGLEGTKAMSKLGCGTVACWPDQLEGGNPSAAVAERRWFALRVKPRHEKAAALGLRSKGYEEFLPLYRSRRHWSDRCKDVDLPLFDGYVFCRFDISRRVPVLTTGGVLHIVGHGNQPVALADSQIDDLKAVVSSGLLVEPWPFLDVGCQVVIEEGPLRGAQGTLLEVKGRERLVLSVGLLQRSIAVEVDRLWVRPLREGPA